MQKLSGQRGSRTSGIGIPKVKQYELFKKLLKGLRPSCSFHLAIIIPVGLCLSDTDVKCCWFRCHFLENPGKRSLVGCSSWGHKEPNTNECINSTHSSRKVLIAYYGFNFILMVSHDLEYLSIRCRTFA